MKVVLFCGGMGMRLRDFENTPKPLARIGYRPVLWHLMSYYAHFGFKDFILCLGYRADAIKDYFLNYRETISNDFVMTGGGRRVELLNEDISDWRITFVDTGMHSNIGERLVGVRSFLEDEEMFMASYADGLTDLPLDRYVQDFAERDETGCFLSVSPTSYGFHLVESGDQNLVDRIQFVGDSKVRINGGFFIFRSNVWDYIQPGEELVVEPFHRMIADRQLISYPHEGFWHCMDTFKDKQVLEDLDAQGHAPWQVWKKVGGNGAAAASARTGGGHRLFLGAHCDDVEIGCGGTILRLREERPDLDLRWVIFTGSEERHRELFASAERFMGSGASECVAAHNFRDGFLPYEGSEVKMAFERVKRDVATRRDLHAPPRGSAPGPPAGVRAHVEYLAQPHDLRVRDPQVRRRADAAERPSFRSRGSRSSFKAKDAARGLSLPGDQGMVRRRHAEGHPAPARGRVQRARALRRGLPRAQARTGPVEAPWPGSTSSRC